MLKMLVNIVQVEVVDFILVDLRIIKIENIKSF